MGTKGSVRIPSTECWNGSIGGPRRFTARLRAARLKPKSRCFLGGGDNNFFNKIRSFLDAIKEGGTAPVPTSQILYNQMIIDGIVKSNKVGHEIKLEFEI